MLVEGLRGRTTEADAHDPLGRPINAPLGWVHDGASALVAMAHASGLGLLTPAERDAELATVSEAGDRLELERAGGSLARSVLAR